MAIPAQKRSDKLFLFFMLGFVAVIIVVFIALGSSPGQNSTTAADVLPTTVDGRQLIQIIVQSGYSPRVINAKANVASTLRMSTNNSYGCDTAFTIPKLGVRQMLPASGDTDIAIAAQAPGTSLVGTCSMGMYSFTMNFN